MEQVCIANISPKERRKRLDSGIMAAVISLIVLIVLVVTAASPWWRLALFPLFAGAAAGYFQWRDAT